MLTRFRNALRRLSGNETGAESVEFALAICIWIGAAFLLMYSAFALYTAHFVANAAEDAARYAIVRGSTANGASCSTSPMACSASSSDVSSYITNSLPPALSSSNVSVATSWPGTTPSGATCDTADGNNSPNCLVKVTVSYNFSFAVPIFPQSTLPFSSTSKMTILR